MWVDGARHGRRIARLLRCSIPLFLAAFLVAMVAGLGAASSGRGATVYYSGSLNANTWLLDTGWNGWSFNEAFNCFCGGPLVGIKQKLSDGREVRYHTAKGR